MTSDRADWVGKTVGEGRFQILRKLGEGGMGFVYQAHDGVLETDVVIKVPRRSMLDDPEFKARFARENRALVKLQHPHIVSILFVGEAEGLPYAVMQYLPGGDLKDRQTAAGRGRIVPLPPADLATWLPGIAKALDFIHAQGFIHRDVKPANILFDGHGNVYLSDFGVAKVISEKQTRQGTSLTGTGMVLGTPEYMAPELIMGESFDGKVDQYALAISVYEVLCGKTPFEGTKSESILVKQVTEAVPPLKAVNPSISQGLCDRVMRGLSKDAGSRYATCSEFADAILDALKRGPATSRIAAPLVDEGIVEPVLLEPSPPKGRETAKVGALKTAVHQSIAPPATAAEAAASATATGSAWGSLLALWVGLALVFGGFISALAMMGTRQTNEDEAERKLTDEEKMLAVPLAAPHPDRDYTNSLGMKMISIGPGRFLGSSGAADWKKWDKLVEPFWIADGEVSVAQYFAFVNDQAGDKTAYYPEWLKSDNPAFVDGESSAYHQSAQPIYQNGMSITGITYAQMQKFCEWLSGRPGEIMQYRLPTREEWVCAYRAGTETTYYWGDNFQLGQLNTAFGSKRPLTLEATHTLPTNPWRLYHIAGNVAEVLAGGEHAAGGHWKTTQAEHHSGQAVFPVTNELWLYGFRVVAMPKASKTNRDE